MRKITYPDVFELYVAAPAGVQLQRNLAVKRGRLGVGKIHHRYTVQGRLVAKLMYLYQVVVPIAHPYHALIFRCRPNHPPPPILRAYARSVVHDRAVDLELHPLRHIRGSRFEGGVEEDSTVAITHTSICTPCSSSPRQRGSASYARNREKVRLRSERAAARAWASPSSGAFSRAPRTEAHCAIWGWGRCPYLCTSKVF